MQVLLIVAACLLVIMLVAFAGWFLALRPILSGLAQNQIDSEMTSAVNQITPAELLLIPPGRASVSLTQAEMTNFLNSNTTPSDPVQHLNMTVTPAELQLDFQTYGLTSTITGVPQAVNGQIVITDVKVQGIAALLLSPGDLTTSINAHLRDAGLRLQRPATGVMLKNGEMDIQLS
jgi:hypothetical protein